MPVINYVWDPTEDNIVREYDGAGVVTAEYTTEPDLYGNVISQRRQGEYRQFHYDGQGSTLAATDENQNVTDTFAYTALGEVTERTGTSEIPFQYIGRQGYYREGANGEYIVRLRAYDPRRARWFSVDRLGLLDGLNQYEYVGNRPASYLDPAGLMKCEVKPPGIRVDKDPREFFNKDLLDGFLGREFRVQVDFAGDCCNCCEYRQMVKGFGPRARFVPGGAWQYANNNFGLMPPANQDTWREDCAGVIWIESPEIAAPIPIADCYGHRSAFNVEGDSYHNPDDRDRGCGYRSKDAPGLPGINSIRKAAPKSRLEVEIVLYFRLIIYDFCTLDAKGKATEVAKEEFGFVSKQVFPALE